MTIVIDRAGKGSALTHNELDANWDSVCGINEPQTGTTYTVVAADQNRTIEFLNASPVAVTVTQISSLISAIDTSDFKVTMKNLGAGLVTITPTTDTFDDTSATQTLSQYESITIQTDDSQSLWNILARAHSSVTMSTAPSGRVLTTGDEGTGNGLDADTVDGVEASGFLSSTANATTTGDLTVSNTIPAYFLVDGGGTAGFDTYKVAADSNVMHLQLSNTAKSAATSFLSAARNGSSNTCLLLTLTATDINMAGQFQLNGVDVTATAAELNYNDITTLGTGAASKAVVLDSSSDYIFPSASTIYYASTDNITLVGATGAIIIGSSDGSAQHVAFDANEIQSKSNATTAGTIQINKLGGAVLFGNGTALSSFEVDCTSFILNGNTLAATFIEIDAVCDGSTADSGITVASGDLLPINDAGTMKQTDVDDVDTYFSQTTKTLTNKTIAAPTITGTPTVDGDDLHPLVSGTFTATTSGTSHSYTSIPSWVTKITLSISDVSMGTAGDIGIQIGDSGGLENSGYEGDVIKLDASSNTVTANSSEFIIADHASAGNASSGVFVLTLIDAANFEWCLSGNSTSTGTTGSTMQVCAGRKALSAALDRVALVSAATFDAGKVNILYE